MLHYIKGIFNLIKKDKGISKGLITNDILGVEVNLSSYYSFYNVDDSSEKEYFLIPRVDINRGFVSYQAFPTLQDKNQYEEMALKLDKFPGKVIQIVVSLPNSVLESLLLGKVKIEGLGPANIAKLKEYYKTFKKETFVINSGVVGRLEELKDTLVTLGGNQDKVDKFLATSDKNLSNEELITLFFTS